MFRFIPIAIGILGKCGVGGASYGVGLSASKAAVVGTAVIATAYAAGKTRGANGDSPQPPRSPKAF